MSKIKIVSPENPEGFIRDMTPEEQARHDADVEKAAKDKADREAAEQRKAELKASAKAKLIAGDPLTAEEADEIVL